MKIRLKLELEVTNIDLEQLNAEAGTGDDLEDNDNFADQLHDLLQDGLVDTLNALENSGAIKIVNNEVKREAS